MVENNRYDPLDDLNDYIVFMGTRYKPCALLGFCPYGELAAEYSVPEWFEPRPREYHPDCTPKTCAVYETYCPAYFESAPAVDEYAIESVPDFVLDELAESADSSDHADEASVSPESLLAETSPIGGAATDRNMRSRADLVDPIWMVARGLAPNDMSDVALGQWLSEFVHVVVVRPCDELLHCAYGPFAVKLDVSAYDQEDTDRGSAPASPGRAVDHVRPGTCGPKPLFDSTSVAGPDESSVEPTDDTSIDTEEPGEDMPF